MILTFFECPYIHAHTCIYIYNMYNIYIYLYIIFFYIHTHTHTHIYIHVHHVAIFLQTVTFVFFRSSDHRKNHPAVAWCSGLATCSDAVPATQKQGGGPRAQRFMAMDFLQGFFDGFEWNPKRMHTDFAGSWRNLNFCELCGASM